MKKPACPTCKAPLSRADYGRLCPACRSSKGKLAELHLAFGKNLGVNPKWRRLLREAAPLLVDYEGPTRSDALVDWVAETLGGTRNDALALPIAEVVKMVQEALPAPQKPAPVSEKPADDKWTNYSSPAQWAHLAGVSVDQLKVRMKQRGIEPDKLTSKQWRFLRSDVPRLKTTKPE